MHFVDTLSLCWRPSPGQGPSDTAPSSTSSAACHLSSSINRPPGAVTWFFLSAFGWENDWVTGTSDIFLLTSGFSSGCEWQRIAISKDCRRIGKWFAQGLCLGLTALPAVLPYVSQGFLVWRPYKPEDGISFFVSEWDIGSSIAILRYMCRDANINTSMLTLKCGLPDHFALPTSSWTVSPPPHPTPSFNSCVFFFSF